VTSDLHGEGELERAWEALDAGRPEAALAALANVDEQLGERWVAEGLAWLALGDARRTDAALVRALALLGEDDAGVIFARGEAHLASWRIAAAQAEYERLEPDAGLLERLALCADLLDEPELADELLAEASELDPDGPPPPPRLTPEEFESAVAEAAAKLPPPFAEVLERVPVIVVPMPTVEVVGRESHPETCGLFSGPSALDESVLDVHGEPARIHLFQRNIERLARDHDELLDEIHVTLYHELGHALGFDEEGVEAMGLE